MEWQDCIDVDEVNASFLEGIAVHQTEDGNFLSMARSYDKNVVLFKYNEDGTLGWSKELYLEAYDYWWEDFNNKIVRTYDMQLTDDGGCICYGHYFGGKLIKLNTDGDVIYEYYTNSHLDNIRYINPVNHSMITSYISSDSEKEPSFSLTYWTHSNNKVK